MNLDLTSQPTDLTPSTLAASSSNASPWLASLTLYQASGLQMVPDQAGKQNKGVGKILHGFTGKPASFGGAAWPRAEVLQNRQQLCQAFGLVADRLIVPDQVHGDRIRSCQDTDFSGTDAVVVDCPGIPVMLMFADCVPIILYAPSHHVGAVIHAGWRGTAQSIAAKTLEHLKNGYGIEPSAVNAAIGPSIGPCCYEVAPEVVEALAQTVSAPRKAFSKLNTQGRPQVDLQQVNALQLNALECQQVEVLPVCTQCHPEQLWSHRRGEVGRQAAFLQLF